MAKRQTSEIQDEAKFPPDVRCQFVNAINSQQGFTGDFIRLATSHLLNRPMSVFLFPVAPFDSIDGAEGRRLGPTDAFSASEVAQQIDIELPLIHDVQQKSNVREERQASAQRESQKR